MVEIIHKQSLISNYRLAEFVIIRSVLHGVVPAQQKALRRLPDKSFTQLIQNSIQVLHGKGDIYPYSIQKIYLGRQTLLRQPMSTDLQRQVFSTMHMASA